MSRGIQKSRSPRSSSTTIQRLSMALNLPLRLTAAPFTPSLVGPMGSVTPLLPKASRRNCTLQAVPALGVPTEEQPLIKTDPHSAIKKVETLIVLFIV